jgi:hypothetical protein
MAELQTREDQLAALIAKATAAAVADAVVKVQEKTTPNEVRFIAPPDRPKLTRKTIFCGAIEEERRLSDEEILLYNQVTPGRYHNRRWEVIEREEGSDGKTVEIRIPVSTVDDRMQLPSLVNILKEMIQEAKTKAK